MNSTSRPDPEHVAGVPGRFTAAVHLLRLNAERPDAIASTDDTTRLTFGKLDERVRRCAAGPACSPSACVERSA